MVFWSNVFYVKNFWSLLSVLFSYVLLISSVNININNLQEFFTIRCVML